MTTNISDRKSFVTLLLHRSRPIGFSNRPSTDPASHIMAGQTLTGTDLKSRRNLLVSLTLLAVMGCQQSDTIVRTDAPLPTPVSADVPFVAPAGEDNPTAQSTLTAVSPLPSPAIRIPTVWTSQSLALDVLPGSPLPVATVAETAPAPIEPIAMENKAPVTRATPAPSAAAPAAPVAAPVTTAAPPAPAPAPAPVVPAAATVSVAPSAAADIAARTNAVRSERGLAPLVRDGSLDGGAASWARELATSGVLRHSTLPQQLVGKPWSTVGENVGTGSTSAVIHDALVNSAGHFANIVGVNFTRIGVGAATDVNGRLWVVEVFAG